MDRYDVRCPVCGTVNHSLYLSETDGWMECISCGAVSKTAVTSDNNTVVHIKMLPANHERESNSAVA